MMLPKEPTEPVPLYDRGIDGTNGGAKLLEPEALGPQCPSDDGKRARMRAHQSWWRVTRLGVPCGTGPNLTSTTPFGNFLRPEDGMRGLNFLAAPIFDVVKARIATGPGVESFRCLHNMLSSQPLCFNLFGMLVNDHERATRLFSALVPDEIAVVRSVRIEHAPAPSSEYLCDRTAFDAFVIYDRFDGTPAFLAVEVKLTEPFSNRMYNPDRYREVARASGAFKDPEDPTLADIRWNQLWRDHLLVHACLQHPSAPAALTGRLVVVHHPADARCLSALASYRESLMPGSVVESWPLDWIVDRWTTAAEGADEEVWARTLRERYVDLSASEGAWESLKRRA